MYRLMVSLMDFADGGFLFAALQGDNCMCASGFSNSQRREETDCDLACSGDSEVRCGGAADYHSVYAINTLMDARSR